MKTLILNGSPKGNSEKSNTNIVCEKFVSKMKNPCEIKSIAKADLKELAQYVKDFDAIIIILPLYIHAMPGIVMKFIEQLEPATAQEKYLGFFIQAGFIETAQHKYVERYFASLAKKLNYNYLGTVSRGEAAGIYMYPKMFKKVLNLVADLGAGYEETRSFDKVLAKQLGKPYNLSQSQLRILNLVNKVGLDNLGWHKILKQNNAYDKRLERPYI